MTKIKYIISFAVALLLSSLFIYNHTKLSEKDNVFVTTVAISGVTEKYSNNNIFYLTVNLDEYTIDEYDLSYRSVSFRINENLYNNIIINDSYIGITLEVTIPDSAEVMDIGTILEGKYTEFCHVVAITTKDNKVKN